MSNLWDRMAEQEKMQLLHWLLSRDILDLPNILIGSVNPAELETEMQQMDWDYAFYDPLHDFIEAESEEDKNLFNELERIIVDLQKLESEGGVQVAASQLLQIKYWYGKDMEIQISGIRQETLNYVAEEIPLQFIKKLYNRLKENTMKNEQLDYLSNEIKYGGFDEKLIPVLKENVAKGENKFQLVQETQIGRDTLEARLNYYKSEKTGYYFFNDFTVKIKSGAEASPDIIQYIPRNKDSKFTLKQGYNLAKGRSVGFLHIDDHKQVTETWWMPDKKFTYEDGSPQIKGLPASYKYQVDEVMKKYNILELKDEDEANALAVSVRRGNLTKATAERSDGVHQKVLIAANPMGRALHFYDAENGQKLNRNDFLKPGQYQAQSQSKGKGQGPEEMEAPDLPEAAKKKKLNR